MNKIKASVLIFNGINPLGLEISNSFSKSVIAISGDLKNSQDFKFPKNAHLLHNDNLSTIKLSAVKKIIVILHEKNVELVSAFDLSNYAKYLSDIFQIAQNNNAKIVVTTSLAASKAYVFSKYEDRDKPFDFASLQNFIEKLVLEQGRRTPTYIARVGDIYSQKYGGTDILGRIISDANKKDYIRIDDDGLEKIYPINITLVSKGIEELLDSNKKHGIYTFTSSEGITQLAVANLCLQYCPNISSLKFVKTRNKSVDPIYENIYSFAPSVFSVKIDSSFEKDLPGLIHSSETKSANVYKSSLRAEEDFIRSTSSQLNTKKPNKRFLTIFTICFGLIVFILLLLSEIFMLVNTKLITDGFSIYEDNYNSENDSQIATDTKFMKEKSSSLIDSARLGSWIFFFTNDSLDDNENFINGINYYFEALSYSKDYHFKNFDPSSKDIIYLRIQASKTLINSVNKNRLFWKLSDVYDDMKKIINDVQLS